MRPAWSFSSKQFLEALRKLVRQSLAAGMFSLNTERDLLTEEEGLKFQLILKVGWPFLYISIRFASKDIKTLKGKDLEFPVSISGEFLSPDFYGELNEASPDMAVMVGWLDYHGHY